MPKIMTGTIQVVYSDTDLFCAAEDFDKPVEELTAEDLLQYQLALAEGERTVVSATLADQTGLM